MYFAFGPKDYVIGQQHGLEAENLISEEGKFLASIHPAELHGLSINESSEWVMQKLKEDHKMFLLESTPVSHATPHCWRCHERLICRVIKQWFINLEKNDLIFRYFVLLFEITLAS